jgi:F-type H+-transporting ATPase subunit b
VNDVKARLEAIAQSQGKRLVTILRKLGEAVTAAITAVTEASTSEPHLDPKARKLVRTNLSPLNWLLIAAGSAGAAAALVIGLGFALLDNTSAAIPPLKERTTTLGKRLDAAEHTETALANRVAVAESALTKSATLINSAIAEIQKMQEALAIQSARRDLPPSETATALPDLGPLEKRVAALENKVIAAGTPLAEVNATLKSADSGHEETTFPPFDPANFTPLLIWLALSFGLLYLLMSKIAVPRIENILLTRANKITEDIGKAHALRGQAEEAAAAHDKTIADAKAKALALAQETRANLNAETEAKRLALEAELSAKLTASEAQVHAMKTKAMENVEAIANETAAAIVQHITGKPADQNAIAKAIATIKA